MNKVSIFMESYVKFQKIIWYCSLNFLVLPGLRNKFSWKFIKNKKICCVSLNPHVFFDKILFLHFINKFTQILFLFISHIQEILCYFLLYFCSIYKPETCIKKNKKYIRYIYNIYVPPRNFAEFY